MSRFRLLGFVLLFLVLAVASCSMESPPAVDDDPIHTLSTHSENPPVVFTELPAEDLHFAPWNLIAASIEGDRLDLHVGFSGCQPDHPWTFYISGGFMESWPIQVNGVLVHEVEESGLAYFETTLSFDLLPLKAAYLESYGPGDVLILNLIDFENATHPIEYPIDVMTGIPIFVED